MTFTSIPVRTNAQIPEAGWFNALRTAGEEIQGSGALSVSGFALDETEQITPQDITGMDYSTTSILSGTIRYYVRQEDFSNFTYNIGEIIISRSTNVSTDFEIVSDEIDISGATGRNLITLSITTTGQLQYVSNNPTPVTGLVFTAVTIGALDG